MSSYSKSSQQKYQNYSQTQQQQPSQQQQLPHQQQQNLPSQYQHPGAPMNETYPPYTALPNQGPFAYPSQQYYQPPGTQHAPPGVVMPGTSPLNYHSPPPSHHGWQSLTPTPPIQEGPELISPKPQRLMPSVPQDMAQNLQNKMDDDARRAEQETQQFLSSGISRLSMSESGPSSQPIQHPSIPQLHQDLLPQQQQQHQQDARRPASGQANHVQQATHLYPRQSLPPSSFPGQPYPPAGSYLGPGRSPSPMYAPQNYVPPQSISRLSPSSHLQNTPPPPPLPARPLSSSPQSLAGQQHSFGDIPPSVNDLPSIPPLPSQKPPLRRTSSSLFDLDLARLNELRQVKQLHSNDEQLQIRYAKVALRAAERAPKNPTHYQKQFVDQWLQDGISIIEHIAQKGNPEAIFVRGTWYEYGKFGRPLNKKEAFKAYDQSARMNYPKGNFKVGKEFERLGDVNSAIQCFQRGILLDDVASHYRMGMIYLLGQHGQTQDFPRALSLIRRAGDLADEDCPQPAYVFGMLLSHDFPEIKMTDEILQRNEEEAKRYIEKASELGFPPAQFKLGYCYEFSTLGCKFDPNQSVYWYTLAAQQGEAEAHMSLSKWYLCGAEGCFEKDEGLAFKYAETAAIRGLASAEFAMGYFYEVGVHVAKNLENAKMWYQKAAEHENNDAKGRLEGISRRKTLSRRDHENNLATTLQKRRTQAKVRSEEKTPNIKTSSLPPSRMSSSSTSVSGFGQMSSNMNMNSLPPSKPIGVDRTKIPMGSIINNTTPHLPPVPSVSLSTLPSQTTLNEKPPPKKGPQSFDQMEGIAEYKKEDCSIM